MKIDKRSRYYIFSLKKPNKEIIDAIIKKCEDIDAVLTYNVVWFNEDIRLFAHLILRKKPLRLAAMLDLFKDVKSGKKRIVMTHLKHDSGEEWLKHMKDRYSYAGPLSKNEKEHPFFEVKRRLSY